MLEALFDQFPLLRKLFADGGYQGPKFRHAAKRVRRRLKVEIVKRSDLGFKVLPKRCVIERTFAWFGRCGRLAKNFECSSRSALAVVAWASIRLMLRRLSNAS